MSPSLSIKACAALAALALAVPLALPAANALAAPAAVSHAASFQDPGGHGAPGEPQPGDAHAAFEYGFALLFPDEGDADPAGARYWLGQAYEEGDPEAAWALGLVYRDGMGVDADLDRAWDFFAEAWEVGLPPAGLALAELDLYEFEGRAEAGAETLSALTEDETFGPRAAMLLADALFFGAGDLPADEARAVALASQALEADPSLYEAHYLLGVAAMEGAGRSADPAAARRHWQAGSESGDAYAMTALADAFEHGEGGPQDLVEARALYGAAAALGDPQAAESAEALNARLDAAARQRAEAREAEWLGLNG